MSKDSTYNVTEKSDSRNEKIIKFIKNNKMHVEHQENVHLSQS